MVVKGDAAESARKAEADRLAAAREKAGEATPNDNHLRAQIDFASLQGKLAFACSWQDDASLGEKDGVGGSMMGQVVETCSLPRLRHLPMA